MKPGIHFETAAARTWTRQGAEEARAGNTEAAVQAYERALECSPAHMPAHLNLASLLLHTGQPEAALEACERAREQEAADDHPYLWLVSGMAHADLNDRWAAEEDLIRYQENAPDPRFTRVVWRTLRELDRSQAYRRARRAA